MSALAVPRLPETRKTLPVKLIRGAHSRSTSRSIPTNYAGCRRSKFGTTPSHRFRMDRPADSALDRKEQKHKGGSIRVAKRQFVRARRQTKIPGTFLAHHLCMVI